MIGSATLLLLAPIAKADLLTSSAPSSINFGSVALDTTATDKFTVSIDPGYSLLGGTGSGINAPFSLAFGGCAGTSCTVDESYTATSLGAVGGTLGIDECPNGGGACVAAAIPLSGLGYSVLQAATPSTLSFGSVALNTTKTITFTVPVDKGYSFLGASGAGINSPYSASFSNCNGSNCTVHESYTPTSLTSSSGGTLNLDECPDGGGACLAGSAPVSGKGFSLLQSSAPSSINFGTITIGKTGMDAFTVTVDKGYTLLGGDWRGHQRAVLALTRQLQRDKLHRR